MEKVTLLPKKEGAGSAEGLNAKDEEPMSFERYPKVDFVFLLLLPFVGNNGNFPVVGEG